MALVTKGKKVKESIAVNGTPSHSYGVSLAVWDHRVLPSTRHKRHKLLTMYITIIIYRHRNKKKPIENNDNTWTVKQHEAALITHHKPKQMKQLVSLILL